MWKKEKTLNYQIVKSQSEQELFCSLCTAETFTQRCFSRTGSPQVSVFIFQSFLQRFFLLSPFLEERETVCVNLFIASPLSGQWSYQEVASLSLWRPTSSDQETWGSQVARQEALLLLMCQQKSHLISTGDNPNCLERRERGKQEMESSPSSEPTPAAEIWQSSYSFCCLQ